MTVAQNKNGNKQGCFEAKEQTFTLKDGSTVTWAGRGRMPLPLKNAIEAGEVSYTSPFKIAKETERLAKEVARAERKAAKEAEKAAKAKAKEDAKTVETQATAQA